MQRKICYKYYEIVTPPFVKPVKEVAISDPPVTVLEDSSNNLVPAVTLILSLVV